ncbi:MAG: hypothetical protein WA810_09875 [Maribacter sp.]
MKNKYLIAMLTAFTISVYACREQNKEVESIEDPLEDVKDIQAESMEKAKERARTDEVETRADSIVGDTLE